jgi:hypothetical protein
LTDQRIKYVKWRNGRPRFEPGPSQRRAGMRGRDLRHDDGTWYLLHEAKQFSEDLRQHTQAERRGTADPYAMRKARRGRRQKPKGFVYFIWSGDHIKIGYSADPLRRLSDISTLLPDGLRALVCVPGEMSDEHRLHHALRAHRKCGEWFNATDRVMQVMNFVLVRGCVDVPRRERPSNGQRKPSQSELESVEPIEFIDEQHNL